MFLDLPVLSDLQIIRDHRQVLIDENLRRHNLKHRSFDYRAGEQILIRALNPKKLGVRTEGPFSIIQVHVNGTITIQRMPHVLE